MSKITNHERFITIHRNHDGSGPTYIIKDTETGVLYLKSDAGSHSGVGVTPLLDADGKVIVDK